MAWIGQDLERLRKLRGLRREDVAAQLSVPVSPSTIRNIEHDASYNVSLDLLRQIATVLGAELRVSVVAPDFEADAPAQIVSRVSAHKFSDRAAHVDIRPIPGGTASA
jgi:transcriptional regulator with XRE-family HTH domain